MILISACLVGIDCRYNGGSYCEQELMTLVEQGKAVLVCPEQLGGMSTPRPPCEIVGGDGTTLLEGQTRVLNCHGEDKSDFFIKGAKETLKIAKLYKAKGAILKAKSPSCGSGQIYDGTFSRKLQAGDGVTAALLKNNGLVVLDESNFREYIEKM
ncbi:DUF523 domain-containing protein [Geosporobacter ferrireducens]|uniref:Uncharacterized protein n=1 Tax=Geosporobacter ferrireducens TaxID=1424294 RepID=A0A1D8GD40_9FIRM|nr:DUF523 domain-containing protein [Geosporobacter ferrireducens]AOT68802.1 hypothetical protein Gferi_04035 [Geosporobacter ferrireducens]MTI56458.1 DUF523 domain-containing protein [Geosporobacter ferrireducens]